METSDALNQAAYRVLYERFQPMTCSNRDVLEQTIQGLGMVANWANEQPSDVRMAYRRAIVAITSEAFQWLDRHEQGFAAEKAYKKLLPGPPEWSELLKNYGPQLSIPAMIADQKPSAESPHASIVKEPL